jgi:hypothetical protein
VGRAEYGWQADGLAMIEAIFNTELNNMSKTVGVPALLLLLLIVVGCSSAPILNIKDAAITSSHSPEEVRQAIVAACADRGWRAKEVSPGVLRATLHVRTFDAEIEIAYSSTAYSINYVSSTNLDFKNGQIHNNYNKWVNNLSHSIQQRLYGAPTVQQ